MKTFHIDEPREIGKKKLRISSGDKKELRDEVVERVVTKRLREFIKRELKNDITNRMAD
tara:strand:+ start:883 stop:1059 length:177 start_codon:yes stop_codon:yes gene_type:complete